MRNVAIVALGNHLEVTYGWEKSTSIVLLVFYLVNYYVFFLALIHQPVFIKGKNGY